ncbi:MAG: hypothetical protein JO259_16830 [Mycobacterium sp.]|nr:hypothetical protein [Mycobacterium sp.]
MLAATHRISTLPPLFDRLLHWGAGGSGDPGVAVMLSTVYVVWAISTGPLAACWLQVRGNRPVRRDGAPSLGMRGLA